MKVLALATVSLNFTKQIFSASGWDFTGFGLAGHGLEMAKASRVTLAIDFDALPILDQALEMYRQGVTTGVNDFNQRLIPPSD
jgi:selenophosphate synthase